MHIYLCTHVYIHTCVHTHTHIKEPTRWIFEMTRVHFRQTGLLEQRSKLEAEKQGVASMASAKAVKK